jgi:hypothetical protein
VQWFAAYTTPRHDKHAAEMLAERRIQTFFCRSGGFQALDAMARLHASVTVT